MVTLEIDTTGIRILETNGNQVIKWASHALEPDMFQDGIIANPQALGVIIKELMSSSDIKTNRVTASVSGLYSLSRIIIVHTPPDAVVTEQSVIEAVEEILPLSEEDMYLSWHSIGIGEGGHQVLAHAVPREMIDAEMQTLRIAGVNTRVLNLKTMALARAVNREEALILNVDSDSFDIVMVIDGMAEVMRTTAWQQDNLTKEEKVEYLVSALELTVSFYDSTRPGFPFDRNNPLFITGQMSGDSDLIEDLKASVEYPVEQLEPPLEYPEHLPVSQYAVNIGLALYGAPAQGDPDEVGYLTPDINLLPRAYRPWRPTTRQTYVSFAFIAALALLFPLYQLSADAMDNTGVLETKYNSVNSLLDMRRNELAKRTPLEQVIKEHTQIVNMGGGFVEDLETIKTLADELNVQIPSINHSGDKITFNCQADSNQLFVQFKTALEESGRFRTPITPPERYPFITSGSITLQPLH